MTIPNALSVLRLLGVPLFLWLLLGPQADRSRCWCSAVAGISDYLDGKIARAARPDQQARRRCSTRRPTGSTSWPRWSRFVLRDIIPWWLAALIVGRDLVLAPGAAGAAPARATARSPVHYLGKAATFSLLYAFPLLLIGAHDWPVSDVARPIAWAFVDRGTALYLFSAGST